MTITSASPEAAEIVLMQKIHANYGALIADICKNSSVPAEFLAALIAGESGGEPTKRRFEKNALCQLWEVVLKRQTNFGSITFPVLIPTIEKGDCYESFISLDDLATSWGLTQIMGYESIPFHVSIGVLQDSAGCLNITCRMLAQFAERFQLDLSKDFDPMFRCWNAGRPHAQTYDPAYSPNGLRRLALYRDLLDGPPKAMNA